MTPLAGLALVVGVASSTAADYQRAAARWEALAEETLAHFRSERSRRTLADARAEEFAARERAARADAAVLILDARRALAVAESERDARVSAASRAWATVGGGLLGGGLTAVGTSLVACSDAECRGTGSAIGAGATALGTLLLWFALDPPW